jgi:hypothetical protein
MLLVLSIGAALCLSAGVALAQAQSTTDTFRLPISTFNTNPCTGEEVTTEGYQTFVFHSTEDANGGFHGTFQGHYQGDSPAGYREVNNAIIPANFNTNGTNEDTFVQTYRFISTDNTRSDFIVNFTLHLVFDEDGTPSLEILNTEEKCTGTKT